jgi:hypothetical protein
MSDKKITRDHVDRSIEKVEFHQFPGTTVTVCLLTLWNGFNVIGQSACVDPENFNKETGEKLARADAVSKVWGLEGYLLKSIDSGIRKVKEETDGLNT